MSDLFDELEDVTPPTVGKEVGEAMTGALEKIAKANGALATMLAMSIAEALKTVDSRNIVIESAEKPEVKQWTFEVKRDKNGLMTQVVAKAA